MAWKVELQPGCRHSADRVASIGMSPSELAKAVITLICVVEVLDSNLD